MVNFKTLFSVLIMSVATVFIASCGDDDDNSLINDYNGVTLSGSWSTDYIQTSYNTTYNGNPVTFSSEKTYVVFWRSHKFDESGTGQQIDVYPQGPYQEIYRTFKWSITKEKNTTSSTSVVNATITYDNDKSVINLTDVRISQSYSSAYVHDTTLIGFDYDTNTRWSEYNTGEAYKTIARDNWEKAYADYLKTLENQFTGDK